MLDTTITRARDTGGRLGATGIYLPRIEEVELRAHIQPVGLEDVNTEGGARLVEQWTIWVNGDRTLLAAQEVGESDYVFLPDSQAPATEPAALNWLGAALSWGTDALVWGGAGRPVGRAMYVITESESWTSRGRSYTRARALRSG